MAEASIAAFGAVAGVLIALGMACFIIRSKWHSNGSHNHDYDKVTTDDAHVHND
jgi:uncharacterized membrane protein